MDEKEECKRQLDVDGPSVMVIMDGGTDFYDKEAVNDSSIPVV